MQVLDFMEVSLLPEEEGTIYPKTCILHLVYPEGIRDHVPFALQETRMLVPERTVEGWKSTISPEERVVGILGMVEILSRPTQAEYFEIAQRLWKFYTMNE